MLLTDALTQTEGLTATEQRLAGYIQTHLASIPALSIEELAAKTYTSHSAIVRLAKKLGYAGYKELRVAIAQAAAAALQTPEPVDANFPFMPTDSTMTIAKKMADLTQAAVARALTQLQQADLTHAADLIDDAKRIFLFASGDSQIRARSLQNRLIKLNKFAVIADEYADEAWTAANLTEDDCAIFITYGGKTPRAEQLMQFLTNAGVPLLLLSGNVNSPLNQLADVALIITQKEFDVMKIGTFASQAAFDYVLNVLFALVYARDYQHHVGALRHKYQQLEDHQLS
ncbi:MurR/RpiR family transcriptional regulator [Lacticaseibacillus mingshuiensis]|uniref:MurR/RpiR family transcriptional regulator n=1 Tax=Lacticaseibacillus mingshuiensis TaxID=2799574 RepID=A0ABW4CKM9_9LACO|nr:MurR/RpiR family transcriptional regulator [Lacticaseibacillus mingshuiensis]